MLGSEVTPKSASMKKQDSKSLPTCCGSTGSEHPPDHSAQLRRLNRIRGQLDGIKRMIEQRTYCPQILTQTAAVKAALASLEASILEQHLNACVRSAFADGEKVAEQRIEELVEIFRKNVA